ncbi:MAG TPA: 1-deoxy-D-xylulose-5-phosphate reductoisomerase [Vicinamibacteria bacterium]|nr:1-deoxy-D-xylulose-5-phosphate reductoisomerase [Vicinamibacteria bacterium]
MGSRGVSILGSTGSIGTNTLKVVERFPDRFRVVGLAAGRQTDRLLEQIARYRPRQVSLSADAPDEDRARVRFEFPEVQVLQGIEGMVEVATHPECDFVMSATVGAVGLVPTLRAIEAGKNVGLANKETLVMAGELMTRAIATSGGTLLPVDSEHNAVHQCLDGRKHDLKRIWLTASGGPFRLSSLEDMRRATKAEALKHPTWNMGRKISIDSATMMNKGLEIIEAHWLFGVSADRVRVVVHPQSTIHSMVEFEDGSLVAQLGVTDMRLPIQYALTYPERVETDLPPLDLDSPLSLDFHPPDHERFPAIGLAYRALDVGGTAPATLNAANEVAVDAFLHDRIGFLSIAEILAETLSRLEARAAGDLESVLEADLRAREEAERLVSRTAPVAIG